MNKAYFLLVAAALLSGCGADKPYSGPGQTAGNYSAPAPPSSAPAHASALPSDPLLSGSDAIPTSDPLLPHDTPAQSDPLIGSDPLKGRSMPTEHSHWLRGRVQDSRLTVLLNGVREGDYAGVVDKDITMKLHRGINTVSFVYTPRPGESSAQMDLLESEHHPAIAPLASFQSLPQPEGTAGAAPPRQVTQKFTFFAN